MTCITMDTFLQMDRMMSYQELRLHGLLETPYHGASVHFVSHEWLSVHHPDPSSVHLRRLQAVFRQICAGDARELFTDKDWSLVTQGTWATDGEWMTNGRSNEEHIRVPLAEAEAALVDHVRSGLIWLDFASIPQLGSSTDALNEHLRSAKLAARSIPHYLGRSTFFWVVAPRARHEDLDKDCGFSSWRQRGWCRLEEWANVLSETPMVPLIVTDAPTISTYEMVHFMLESIGKDERASCMGNFSCCARGHSMEELLPPKTRKASSKITRTPCDKTHVADVLSKMYRSKLKSQLVFAPYMGYLLCSLGHTLCAGVTSKGTCNFMTGDEEESEEYFRVKFGLRAHQKHGGTDLLQAAVWCHHHAMMRKALDRESATSKNSSGQTALDVAVMSGNVEAAQVLLETGDFASVLDLPSIVGSTAVQFAAENGHVGIVELLVTHQASVNIGMPEGPLAGRTALHSASAKWQAECCRVLLEHRASINAPDEQGVTALELASVDRPMLIGNQDLNARRHTLRVLLKQTRRSMSTGELGDSVDSYHQ